MKVLLYSLTALIPFGLVALGVLFGTHRTTAGIWVTFVTIVLIVASICVYWQMQVREQPQSQAQERPDTYIFLYGQEYAYPPGVNLKITLKPIKFPEGMSSVSDPDVPVRSFQWAYPEGTKLYTLVASNRGNMTDRNVKIEVDFDPNSTSIQSIDMDTEVQLLDGGKVGASYAIFKIGELLPDVRQGVRIVTSGNDVKSLTGWSEITKDLEKIFIIDILFQKL
jgi:hypothetical protein